MKEYVIIVLLIANSTNFISGMLDSRLVDNEPTKRSVIMQLLSSGANINAKISYKGLHFPWEPLDLVIKHDKYHDLVQLLLAKNAEISDDILLRAVMHNASKNLSLLLEKLAREKPEHEFKHLLNKSSYGARQTLLWYASAWMPASDSVKILLTQGADFYHHHTPLLKDAVRQYNTIQQSIGALLHKKTLNKYDLSNLRRLRDYQSHSKKNIALFISLDYLNAKELSTSIFLSDDFIQNILAQAEYLHVVQDIRKQREQSYVNMLPQEIYHELRQFILNQSFDLIEHVH